MATDCESSWPHPGARWWKFDFHARTPASLDHGNGPDHASGAITPAEWLLRFMRSGVDCVAVTDSNTNEWIAPLQEALAQLASEARADYRPLHLFPGMEVVANNGTRMLALFDTDKRSADVAKLLGAIRYRGRRGANDAADASAVEIAQAVVDAGGIPLLSSDEASETSRRRSEKAPGTPPPVPGDGALTTLREAGKLFSAAGRGVPSPPPDSNCAWVKMASPSLEGLRLALLDGEGFSLRLGDDVAAFDPFSTPKHWLEAIEIDDARFMGRGTKAVLRFSPSLNALVGGRGTGKSTVIHAVRLTARRERELTVFNAQSSPRLTFEQFSRVPTSSVKRGGLTRATTIKSVVVRDGVRHRIQWRQDGAGVVVEEDAGDGTWQPSAAQTVTPERFPLRIFSQGQIAALAGEDQQALLQVIDEAANTAPLKRTLAEAEKRFYALRARVRELDAKLHRRDDVVIEREDVERKLKRFEDAGHAAVLTAYRRRSRQRRETDRQFAALADDAQRIDDLAGELVPEDLPEGVFDEDTAEDREATDAIAALHEAYRTASSQLRDVARRLRDAGALPRRELVNGAWQTAVDRATANYDRLVEALREEGVTDTNEYGFLTQDRVRLDGDLANLESLRGTRDQLVAQSQASLKDVLAARRAITTARDAFLAEALADNEYVRIETQIYGNDAEAVERSLRSTLEVADRFVSDILEMEDGVPERGCVAELLDGLADASDRGVEAEKRIARLKGRLQDAASGSGGFGGHFNNHLESKYRKTPEVFDKLLTWFPEDGLQVEYSRGDGSGFHPIGQASAGQRAAAILAFLLAHGDEPLVLDQPEDDLDNYLIYDLVVRQIRTNKLRRQLVVVTHNPNIVVNGDAEMLHALDFRAGQCVVAKSGSLQDTTMREEVCRIMEGGREAFERRFRRLGRDPGHA